MKQRIYNVLGKRNWNWIDIVACVTAFNLLHEGHPINAIVVTVLGIFLSVVVECKSGWVQACIKEHVEPL